MSAKDSGCCKVRVATLADVEEIVRVTNLAYVVEHPLIRGERTDASEVIERMSKGRFLVIDTNDGGGSLIGSVFMSTDNGRGYLGMLAVDPPFHGKGMAGVLIKAVEGECLRAHCPFLDITVLSLRRELFAFYRHHGFFASATLPYPRPEALLKPLHMVQMTKPLRPAEEL